jgi:hypothetical protein
MRSTLLLCVALLLSPYAAAQHPTVTLSFSKALVGEGVWEGTISGEVQGKLRTVLVFADQSDPVWRVELEWFIEADDPNKSFVARLRGTINTESGAVVLNGEITEGYLVGSSIREQGQMLETAEAPVSGMVIITARS